jgi:hypothetical protein
MTIYLDFLCFGRSLETVQIRRRIEPTERYTFLVEISRLQDVLSKGLSPSITPLVSRYPDGFDLIG